MGSFDIGREPICRHDPRVREDSCDRHKLPVQSLSNTRKLFQSRHILRAFSNLEMGDGRKMDSRVIEDDIKQTKFKKPSPFQGVLTSMPSMRFTLTEMKFGAGCCIFFSCLGICPRLFES